MKLTVDNLQFHVVDEGAGAVILLLHGFPDSARLWKHLVTYLTSISDWRCAGANKLLFHRSQRSCKQATE